MTIRATTVLIADDHAIVKEGLVSLLKGHDFDVVGAVGDGEQLIAAARRLRPDVIITDLSMPGLSGIEVLALLKRERIPSKVVVLTMHNDGERASQALREGASAFLLKESAGEELVTAIEHALQGRTYLTPSVTRAVMEVMVEGRRPGSPALTPRQREVLRRVAQGQRMKEIAAALNLSTRTVESHKYELMNALGVHSTAQLVRYAIEHGLIDD